MKIGSMHQGFFLVLIICLAVISLSQSHEAQRPVEKAEPIILEKSEPQIEERDRAGEIYNKTYIGRGFSLRIPDGYAVLTSKPEVLHLDPVGEGPNPYNDEIGEGTNPGDDIYISLVPMNADDRLSEIPAEDKWDVETTKVKGHTLHQFQTTGIADNKGYILEIDNGHSLAINITVFDDTSEESVEKLIENIEF